MSSLKVHMKSNRHNIKPFLKNLVIDRLLKDTLPTVKDVGGTMFLHRFLNKERCVLYEVLIE
jgi:hypothetical protein